jgi:hypothetical protein
LFLLSASLDQSTSKNKTDLQQVTHVSKVGATRFDKRNASSPSTFENVINEDTGFLNVISFDKKKPTEVQLSNSLVDDAFSEDTDDSGHSSCDGKNTIDTALQLLTECNRERSATEFRRIISSMAESNVEQDDAQNGGGSISRNPTCNS